MTIESLRLYLVTNRYDDSLDTFLKKVSNESSYLFSN